MRHSLVVRHSSFVIESPNSASKWRCPTKTANSTDNFPIRHIPNHRAAFLLFACSLAVVGCTQTRAPEADSGQLAKVARTQLERGPIKVVVEVSPSPARLSDEPTLTLTFDSEDGVVVEKPPFGEATGDFLIRDFHEPLPRVENGRQILQQVYTLEPMHTGMLQVDPIVVSFVDQRSQADGKRHTLETEALAVEVLSVVEGEVPSLDQLDGFEEPVEVPAPPAMLAWGVSGALLLASAVGFVIWRVRKRRAVAAEMQLSPREIAHLELERLEHEQLSQHDVKLFYVELTGIVRRYIEGTTSVRAAEQTTEEFLRAISSGDRFARDERQRLKRFLEAADLVKFAAYKPGQDDIDESFLRARVFVDEQEVAT